MGEFLNALGSIKQNIKTAQAKNTQQPECGWDDKNSAGANVIQVIRIPFPAAGTDTVDFQAVLQRPADTLYYPEFNGLVVPIQVGFAFTPQGVKLTNLSALALSSGLIQINPLVSWRFRTKFTIVFISAKGTGAGGFFNLLAIDGLEFQSPSS